MRRCLSTCLAHYAVAGSQDEPRTIGLGFDAGGADGEFGIEHTGLEFRRGVFGFDQLDQQFHGHLAQFEGGLADTSQSGFGVF